MYIDIHVYCHAVILHLYYLCRSSCIEGGYAYYFAVDSIVMLDEPKTLRWLIEANRLVHVAQSSLTAFDILSSSLFSLIVFPLSERC